MLFSEKAMNRGYIGRKTREGAPAGFFLRGGPREKTNSLRDVGGKRFQYYLPW